MILGYLISSFIIHMIVPKSFQKVLRLLNFLYCLSNSYSLVFYFPILQLFLFVLFLILVIFFSVDP